MIYGLNNDGLKVAAYPGIKDIRCPSCGEDLIAKCGDINVWHFAHKHEYSCEYKAETEWHLNWKQNFPATQCEVRFQLGETVKIADFVNHKGYAVEFQNSPISGQEISERETFYNSVCPGVFWVINVSEQYEAGNIHVRTRNKKYWDEQSEQKYVAGKWPWAKKTFRYANSDLVLDLGIGFLLVINRIYWDNNKGVGYWGRVISKQTFITRNIGQMTLYGQKQLYPVEV